MVTLRKKSQKGNDLFKITITLRKPSHRKKRSHEDTTTLEKRLPKETITFSDRMLQEQIKFWGLVTSRKKSIKGNDHPKNTITFRNRRLR